MVQNSVAVEFAAKFATGYRFRLKTLRNPEVVVFFLQLFISNRTIQRMDFFNVVTKFKEIGGEKLLPFQPDRFHLTLHDSHKGLFNVCLF